MNLKLLGLAFLTLAVGCVPKKHDYIVVYEMQTNSESSVTGFMSTQGRKFTLKDCGWFQTNMLNGRTGNVVILNIIKLDD